MHFWLAQLAGLIACGLSCVSYFKGERIPYLYLQIAVNLCYVGQYLLLGSYAGIVNCCIWISKLAVFLLLAYRKKDTPLWVTVLFCVAGVALGALVVKTPFDAIPLLIAVAMTIGVAINRPVALRVIVVACSVGWVAFNFYAAAYVASAYSLIEGIATAVSLALFLKREKTAQNRE